VVDFLDDKGERTRRDAVQDRTGRRVHTRRPEKLRPLRMHAWLETKSQVVVREKDKRIASDQSEEVESVFDEHVGTNSRSSTTCTSRLGV
jgi:hypothetical protein